MNATEDVPLAKLKPDPFNARFHPDDNLSAIAASLRQFGQPEPLVVRRADGVVISGNGRLAAMQTLGWDTARVQWVDWDEPKARAYSIVANRTAEMAKWDAVLLPTQIDELLPEFDMGALGLDESFLDSLAASIEQVPPGEIVEDEVPEVPAVPVTQRGDIWLLGRHRLMCGDSAGADVDILMGAEKADLLLTDPPYGVSYADKNIFLNSISRGNKIQKEIANDHQTAEEMNQFWDVVLTNAHRATSDRASYYIFSPQGGDLMMMMMSIRHAKWQLKHMLVWVKNNHVLGRCDYNYKHEPVFFGWKENGTHEFFGDGSCTSVLEFDRHQKSDLHPTMKPVSLCSYLITNSSKANGVVLDLFGGSGSTLMAAEQTGRICCMMEIDPAYCDVIRTRWETLTGDKATKA